MPAGHGCWTVCVEFSQRSPHTPKPVTKPIPSYLRLYSERHPSTAPAVVDAPASMAELCRAFEQATGWPLKYIPGQAPHHELDLKWSAPVDPGVGAPPGLLRIEPSGAGQQPPRCEIEAASQLALAVAEMLAECAS